MDVIQPQLPSGVVLPFAGANAPSGFLLCDGSVVSRTQFAGLFAAIGTSFGPGDGSTTFKIPDTRGIFLRGAGVNGVMTKATGGQYSAAVGVSYSDAMQGHVHQQNVSANNGGSTGAQGLGANGVVGTNLTTNWPQNDGTNGVPRVGDETRPACIGMNHIIKT